MRPATQEGVRALVEALRDSERQVAEAAAEALGRIGPEAKAAVPPLIDAWERSEQTDARGPRNTAAFAALLAIGLSAEEGWTVVAKALREDPGAEGSPLRMIFRAALESPEEGLRRLLAVSLSAHGSRRACALESFGAIRPIDRRVLAAVVGVLSDDAQELRAAAAVVAARMAPEHGAGASALLDALDDPERAAFGPDDRLYGDALARILPWARSDELLRALRVPESGVRSAARTALQQMLPKHPEILEDVVAGPLVDPDRAVRQEVVEVLTGCVDAVPSVVSGLTQALQDPSPEIRCTSAAALMRANASLEPAVRTLLGVVRAEKGFAGGWAAAALRGLGERARPLAGLLVTALGEKDPEVRRAAWHALDRVDPLPPEAAGVLARLLEDPDLLIQLDAVDLAARLGPNAAQIVPALCQVLRGTGRHAAERAAEILGHAGPVAVPGLTSLLREGDVAVRLRAAECLAGIGPGAAGAIPELAGALRDPDPGVRLAAVRALAATSPESRTAVLPLAEALSLGGEEACGLALEGLERFGPAAHEAAPFLVRAVDAGTPAVRRGAIRVLGAIGSMAGEPAAQRLIAALRDPDPSLREAAAVALGQMTWHARAAAPELVRALEDESPAVSAAAQAALKRLHAKE